MSNINDLWQPADELSRPGEKKPNPTAWIVDLEGSDRLAVLDAVTQARKAIPSARSATLVGRRRLRFRSGPIAYRGVETAAELIFTENQVQLHLGPPSSETTLLVVMPSIITERNHRLPLRGQAALVLGRWCDVLASGESPDAHARIAASNQRLTEIATQAFDALSGHWTSGVLWSEAGGLRLRMIEGSGARAARTEFSGAGPSADEGGISPALQERLDEASVRQAHVKGVHEVGGKDASGRHCLSVWILGPPRLVFDAPADPVARLRFLSKAAPLPEDARLIAPSSSGKP